VIDDPAFEADGAAHVLGVLDAAQVEAARTRLNPGLAGRPGRRLSSGLDDVLARLTPVAAALLGQAAFPVRAVAFDKTPDLNWSVGWHQDRTIAVSERREAPGYGPWSTKDGIPHVQPPVAVLERMVTLRLHLDDCGEDNAPLTVALGSHRQGIIPAADAAFVARSLPNLSCQARAGDVWAYRTLILHMSERSRASARRRVLQVDYAAEDLPGGLRWRTGGAG
jgi:hypothetical protein